jgi:transcriptional regulator with XRE-family HTH domain
MADKELSKKLISNLIQQDGRGITGIARALGITRQRLSNYAEGKRFPDADFMQRWKKTFNIDLMDAMETGVDSATNVARGTGKHTPVDKLTDNPELRDKVYRDVLESKTEYRLIHHSLLSEKYLMIPVAELDKSEAKTQKVSTLYEDLLKEKDNVIEFLKSEIKELRAGSKVRTVATKQ